MKLVWGTWSAQGARLGSFKSFAESIQFNTDRLVLHRWQHLISLIFHFLTILILIRLNVTV